MSRESRVALQRLTRVGTEVADANAWRSYAVALRESSAGFVSPTVWVAVEAACKGGDDRLAAAVAEVTAVLRTHYAASFRLCLEQVFAAAAAALSQALTAPANPAWARVVEDALRLLHSAALRHPSRRKVFDFTFDVALPVLAPLRELLPSRLEASPSIAGLVDAVLEAGLFHPANAAGYLAILRAEGGQAEAATAAEAEEHGDAVSDEEEQEDDREPPAKRSKNAQPAAPQRPAASMHFQHRLLQRLCKGLAAGEPMYVSLLELFCSCYGRSLQSSNAGGPAVRRASFELLQRLHSAVRASRRRRRRGRRPRRRPLCDATRRRHRHAGRGAAAGAVLRHSGGAAPGLPCGVH